MAKKMCDLRDLLSEMDDYVITPQESEWLSFSLEGFRKQTPEQLIIDARIREIVIEFDRLREGQPV